MDNPEAPPGIESKAEEEISRHRKLVERIAQFDEPPENLDFTISGKDCEYKVHSSVICSRSRFFDRAVKGRFVVGNDFFSTPIQPLFFTRILFSAMGNFINRTD